MGKRIIYSGEHHSKIIIAERIWVLNDMGHFPTERLVALLSDSKMNSLEREKCDGVLVQIHEYAYRRILFGLVVRTTNVRTSLEEQISRFWWYDIIGIWWYKCDTTSRRNDHETIIILREYFLATWKVIQ